MRGKIRSGFTLVEILVVISIISILAGISVAGFSSLRGGTKQELTRTTRHLHSLLHAAKVHADTFNVRTAVVYNMDNYADPPAPNTMVQPMVDPVTGKPIRVITSAAIYYELPRTAGDFAGKFVPVDDDSGFFSIFEGEQVIMLNDLDPGDNFRTYYYRSEARYNPETEGVPGSGNEIYDLGMSSVETFADGTGFFADPESPEFTNYTTVSFPAHIFSPGGRLEPSGKSQRERYTLFIAPPPTENIDMHLIDPENLQGERVFRKVYLYRSTGRVKTDS